MDNKENVNIETPDYLETDELSKSVADELNKIEKEATNAIANAKDDGEPKKIIEKAEKAKKEVVAKKPITAKDTSTKIPGVRISVSGYYVNRDVKVDYEFDDIELPAVDNLLSYVKQAIFLRFKKDGKTVLPEDIISYFLDDEEDTEIDATFLNKNVLTLTEEEVLHAKMFFQLKGVAIDQGVRAARIALYKSICLRMGQQAPAETDTQIKKWKPISLTK